MAIDSRLLDCDSIPQVEENFDRVLAQVDALKVCRITFNSDGGSAISEQIMLNGAKVVEPTAPEKTGFVFAGWYHEDVLWDFDTAVAGSMTLIAHWTEEEAG